MRNNTKRHTVRNEIRSVLDDLIRRKPKDWEDFLRLLTEEGYEIKRGKNISIKGRSQKRFVRLRSLGEDYTEDALKGKISRANVRDDLLRGMYPKGESTAMLVREPASIYELSAGLSKKSRKICSEVMTKIIEVLEENKI